MAIIFQDTSGVNLNKDWSVNPAIAGSTYTLPEDFRNSTSKGEYRLVIYDKSKTGEDKVNKIVYDEGTSSFSLPTGFVYDDTAGTLEIPSGFNGAVSLIRTTGNPLFDSSDPNDFFTKSDIPDNNNQMISKTFRISFTDNDYENVIIRVEDLLGNANADGDIYPDMDTMSISILSNGTEIFSGQGTAGSDLNSGVLLPEYTTNGSVLDVTLTMDLSNDLQAWNAIDKSLFFLNYNIKASGNTVAVL
jgi:hypothetical protein